MLIGILCLLALLNAYFIDIVSFSGLEVGAVLHLRRGKPCVVMSGGDY